MKKILKRMGIIVGSLAGLMAILIAGLFISTNRRFNRIYDIAPERLVIPNDAVSLAVGERWVDVHCRYCHEEDLGGGPFFEEPDLGSLDAPNLTSGKGGIGSDYTDEDWIRALRHGVKQDGTSMFIMPSNNFYYFGDEDMGAIVAYLKTVPPVDRETRPRSLTPMARVMYALGAFGDLLYAETIQHDVRPETPPVGRTLEYGNYLVNVNGCRSCHGDALSGKQPSEPGAPFAPNLTPGGLLAGWSETEFITTLRTGVNPYNRELSESMPKSLGKLTEEELKTIWLFLQSLPALESTLD